MCCVILKYENAKIIVLSCAHMCCWNVLFVCFTFLHHCFNLMLFRAWHMTIVASNDYATYCYTEIGTAKCVFVCMFAFASVWFVVFMYIFFSEAKKSRLVLLHFPNVMMKSLKTMEYTEPTKPLPQKPPNKLINNKYMQCKRRSNNTTNQRKMIEKLKKQTNAYILRHTRIQ